MIQWSIVVPHLIKHKKKNKTELCSQNTEGYIKWMYERSKFITIQFYLTHSLKLCETDCMQDTKLWQSSKKKCFIYLSWKLHIGQQCSNSPCRNIFILVGRGDYYHEIFPHVWIYVIISTTYIYIFLFVLRFKINIDYS